MKNSNKLLDETRQPYSYLIDSMRKRDGELEQQRNMVVRLEQQVSDLKSDNKEVKIKLDPDILTFFHLFACLFLSCM